MSAENAIARAKRYLKTAELLINEGDYASSVSRPYYAMFYVARALLERSGSEPGTHSGLQISSGFIFAKEGPLSEQFAQMLNDAEEMRTMADYSNELVLTIEDAQTTFRDAKVFVERMSVLLRDAS